MSLGELIKALESADQDRIVPLGFAEPMSYRGYYSELAFEPAKNVTIASMLAHAKSALGATFEGYKGGSYVMTENTPCWIAEYGSCYRSDLIGPVLLAYLCGKEHE